MPVAGGGLDECYNGPRQLEPMVRTPEALPPKRFTARRPEASIVGFDLVVFVPGQESVRYAALTAVRTTCNE